MEILVALIALGVSLYTLYEIEKLKKKNHPEIEKGIKDNDKFKQILMDLRNKDCEIMVKKPMFYIDIIDSVEGKIIDLDDEWVMIRTNGRKPKNLVFRISLIKDVKELLK